MSLMHTRLWKKSKNNKGFTLVEVVVGIAILATLISLSSLIWAGNLKRLTKIKKLESVTLLLEQKMNELETLYKNENINELLESEEGNFPNHEGFTWKYETKPLTLPSTEIFLKIQNLPQNDINTQLINTLKELLSETVVELKLTVTYVYNKKDVNHSLSTYFVNHTEAPLKIFSILSQLVPSVNSEEESL